MRWKVEVDQECHHLETDPIKRCKRIINVEMKSNKIKVKTKCAQYLQYMFTIIHISA